MLLSVVKVQNYTWGTLHPGLGPDNGRVHFTSIITIWGGGTLWTIN